MSSIKSVTCSLLVTALLGACASGKGSFDLDTTEPKPSNDIVKNHRDDASVPRREDIEQAAQAELPALGYVAAVPRLGSKMQDMSVSVNAINDSLDEVVSKMSSEIANHDKYDDYNSIRIGRGGIPYDDDPEKAAKKSDYEFIRIGHVIGRTKFHFAGKRGTPEWQFFNPMPYGYVFYQASKPSTVMPTQTVAYNGTWDFVSDAVKSEQRKELAEGFSSVYSPSTGFHSGATSVDALINIKDKDKPQGLTAEFNVDFGAKKMTGVLTTNGETTNIHKPQEIVERYRIDADLVGNRFHGKAAATNSDHVIFGKDSANVEGGFFGPKAQELAGKFLTENNSLFVVFGAKRNALDDAQLATALDAITIDVETLQLKQADTFGNITHLIVDGRRLPLLPEGVLSFAEMDFSHTFDHRLSDGKEYRITVCCSNLDYVKFGSYGEISKSENTTIEQIINGQLFLQGERSQMAIVDELKGTAHYRGSWEGHVIDPQNRHWHTSAGNEASDSRALLDFNFDNKTFAGKLFAQNVREDNPTLFLSGQIEKNGFSGVAKTSEQGFSIDPRGYTDFVTLTAKVDGGFYGPNASEVGGVVYSDGGSGGAQIGAVFGAKRQIME